MTDKPIRFRVDFAMLVSMMKPKSMVVLVRENGPSIELQLEKDEVPANMYDALSRLEEEWDMA